LAQTLLQASLAAGVPEVIPSLENATSHQVV
jgi:hypothetical protein